ncbi:hypothetical protein [Nocardioides nanhaiensis]|uniref:Uncharacterized protein n=1 Tax=Nocardioides nanhaiensis TaxID=1476871 RepID=A0ABP8WJV5_9ACTN
MDPVVVPLMLVAVFVVTLGVLTGVGQRRRGGGVGLCVLAAVCFPLAWAGWYVQDRHDAVA